MLLTRSPLSPEPKPWFSLDLHVLSAPPAFVLSQDQTLREDWLPARVAVKPTQPTIFSSSLLLKVSRVVSALQAAGTRDGYLGPQLVRPRISTFYAVEFSKTALLTIGVKKASGFAQRLRLESE